MADPTDGSTVDPGGSTADQVKDRGSGEVQVAQDEPRGALGQARGRLRDQVGQRSTEAGERIAGTASDVRLIAQELRGQGKDTPARVASPAQHGPACFDLEMPMTLPGPEVIYLDKVTNQPELLGVVVDSIGDRRPIEASSLLPRHVAVAVP